jgi:hypothetical protein
VTGTTGAQEVADALAITLEREDPSGAPWCPPRDGVALRRWVIDRSAELGTGIRRVVRLVRVMAVADGRDYVRFLYIRVAILRARQFRSALQVAAAERRLPSAIAVLSDAGIELREPALAARGVDAFAIDFAQMPRIAALLDFLHNALGFSVVADLLEPLAKQNVPAGVADDAARRLHSALNAWLSERLESANHLRQAQRIRAFLASRGQVAPDAIDDETILLFWTDVAAAGNDEATDGFRLYRSAAAALLRYREALRDAATGWHIERAMSGGSSVVEDEHAEAMPEEGGSWQSPLAELGSPPADRIKWLTRKEQNLLFNYLGGPAEEDDASEDDAAGPWQGGLAGDRRFDLAFRLTLLRADVFGAAQASIVARLRKRTPAAEAIAQAMTSVDDAAYGQCVAAYGELRAQLERECLAALAILMAAGAADAVILLDHLAGREAVAGVLGPVGQRAVASEDDEMNGGAVRTAVAPALQAAIADPDSVPGAGKLLREALAAARQVNRAGFRREDRTDADLLAALGRGAPAAVVVMGELARLIAVLSARTPPGDTAEDRARFLAGFRRLYPTANG